MTENTPADPQTAPQATSVPDSFAAVPPILGVDALAQAENELADLRAKNIDLADQFLRAQAEVQNARRRADEEISKSRKFAIEGFAESLLPALDSLNAALAIETATADQLREGTEATLRQLISALERNKVVEVPSTPGTKFDPAHHQAISMVPSEHPAGTIAQSLQKGYLINDRVLRPALVMVSAA